MTITSMEEDLASPGLPQNANNTIGKDEAEEGNGHQPFADENAIGRYAENDIIIKDNNCEEVDLYGGLRDLDTAKEVGSRDGYACAVNNQAECAVSAYGMDACALNNQAECAVSGYGMDQTCSTGVLFEKGGSEMPAPCASSGAMKSAEKKHRNIEDNVGAKSNVGVKKKVVRKRKIVKKANRAPQEPLPSDYNIDDIVTIEVLEIKPDKVDEAEQLPGDGPTGDLNTAEEMESGEAGDCEINAQAASTVDERELLEENSSADMPGIITEGSDSVVQGDLDETRDDEEAGASEHVAKPTKRIGKTKKVIRKKKVLKGTKVTMENQTKTQPWSDNENDNEKVEAKSGPTEVEPDELDAAEQLPLDGPIEELNTAKKMGSGEAGVCGMNVQAASTASELELHEEKSSTDMPEITPQGSDSVVRGDMDATRKNEGAGASEHVAKPIKWAGKTKKVIKKKAMKGTKVTKDNKTQPENDNEKVEAKFGIEIDTTKENVKPQSADEHDVEIRGDTSRRVTALLPGVVMDETKIEDGVISHKVGETHKKTVKIIKKVMKKRAAKKGAQDNIKLQSHGNFKSQEKIGVEPENVANKISNTADGNERKPLKKSKVRGQKMERMEKQPPKTEKKDEKTQQISISKKRKRKDMTRRDVNRAAVAEPKGKAGSSGKNKSKVETMGMIFMCSSKTKNDCYRYNVLGLPASKKDLVAKIYKGMRLFLYDFELRLLYGIYKATGHGGYNIEPRAFKSEFPSQVRFTVLENCNPLPEEQFKKAIKENYYTKNKFNFQLNSVQVKKLCKLFTRTGSDSKSRGLKGPIKTHSPARDRKRRPVLDAHSPARNTKRRPVLDDRTYHQRVPLAVDKSYSRRPVSYDRDEAYVTRAVSSHSRLPVYLPQPDIPPRSSSYSLSRTSDHYRWDSTLRREQGLSYQEPRHGDSARRHLDEVELHDPYVPRSDLIVNHGDVYRDGPEYHSSFSRSTDDRQVLPGRSNDDYHTSVARYTEDYRLPVAYRDYGVTERRATGDYRAAMVHHSDEYRATGDYGAAMVQYSDDYRAPARMITDYRSPVRLTSDYAALNSSYRLYP